MRLFLYSIISSLISLLTYNLRYKKITYIQLLLKKIKLLTIKIINARINIKERKYQILMKKDVLGKRTILIFIIIVAVILAVFLVVLAKKIIIENRFIKEASALASTISVDDNYENEEINQNDILEVGISKEDDDENEIAEEEKKQDENLNNTIENNTKKNSEDNTNKEKNNNSISNNIKHYIKVNRTVNVVTVYKNDNGNLSPIKAFVCSTGAYTPPCAKYPRTQYKLTGNKWQWRKMQGGVYAQYATQVVGNILMHSVPYFQKDPSTLEYLQYDRLGTSASAGCIRLTVRDAKWIFDNISSNTIVEFYSSSNPGPLGKPTAQKISSNIECRGWDPTDSNPDNPWHDYNAALAAQEKEKETTNNTNENQNQNIISQPNSNTSVVNNTNTLNLENSAKNDSNFNTIKENNTNTNSTNSNTTILNNNTITNNNNTTNNIVENPQDNNTINMKDNTSVKNETNSNNTSNNAVNNVVNTNNNSVSAENKTEEVVNQTKEEINENTSNITTEKASNILKWD